MKIQDLSFVVILVLLLLKRDSKLFVVSGIICLTLSIPLFYMQIFFTAQHLVYYSFAFILLSVIFMIIKEKLI